MKGQENTSEYLVTFETGIRMLRVLVRRLPVLVGVFVIAFVVGFFVRNQSPVLFESTSLVVFAPPPYRAARPANDRNGGDEISRMMPVPLSVQDYEIIAKSPPVLKTLRRRAGWKLDGKPIPLADMRDRVRAVSQVIKKTNTDLVYSPILSLTVSETNADNAMNFANTWAEIVVEVSRELARSGAEGMAAFLSTEFDKAGDDFEVAINTSVSRYDEVLGALGDAKHVKEKTLSELAVEHATQSAALAKEMQIESWRARVETIGMTLDVLRTQLAEVDALIAEKTSAAAKAKDQLANLTQTVTLNKGLNDTVLPLAAIEQQRTGKTANLPSVVAEEINEVYVAVADRLSTLEAELAGAAARKTTLAESVARLQSEREELTAEVKDRELKMTSLARKQEAEAAISEIELEQAVERLTLQAKLEKEKVERQMSGQSDVYSELNARLLGARIAEAEIQPDVRILVNAVSSQDALPRRRVFTAGGIAIVLTAFAALGVLLLEAVRDGGEFRRRVSSS